MERLNIVEIESVLDHVPPFVQEQMKRENVVLAGGLIRDVIAGLPVKDVDIFCHSQEQAERLAMEAGTYVTKTLFAFTVKTLRLPVQYVFYKEFADATELVSQFDFRACCAGIYWEPACGLATADYLGGRWVGIAADGFHVDCEDKELRFMSQKKDEGMLTALGRALKLTAKGWHLSTNEAAAIITHWQGAKPTDVDYEFRREGVYAAFRPHYGRL